MGTANARSTRVECGLTAVAVLCEAPDGWRVYEALHLLRLDTWKEDKAAAVEWTHRNGNKLSREEAASCTSSTSRTDWDIRGLTEATMKRTPRSLTLLIAVAIAFGKWAVDIVAWM